MQENVFAWTKKGESNLPLTSLINDIIIDENEINTRADIPFIRTLFKISKFYEFQVIRRSDLVFTNIRTGVSPEYVDCDF